jgi:serine/threonine protein kinase/formylglycine-generating enzyme required for sulfatase activity
MTQARHFGHYELISRLGRGGMGEVWRARHRLLNRQAAVKLIRTEVLSTESGAEMETLLRRFEREAQVTSTLQSPHTVEVYDFGITDDGTFYYAMELLEGLNLQMLIDRYGPLPSERVIYILLQICESLAEAHHRSLIHRDLKPANIFLTRRGLKHDVVKVLDFGLVKPTRSLAAESPQLTTTGAIVGSPAFIAPEAIRGEPMDERADLYALGCVAYWLLSGRLVFEADTIPEMLADHLRRVPEPPSKVTELEIPEELERLVMECLEKEPGNRLPSVQALIPRLEDCPVGQPWNAQRADAWWRLHRPLEAEAPEEAPIREVPAETPVRRLLDESRARRDAQHSPTHLDFDWSEYRRGRIAEWSDPRYQLDSEFVGLTLLVDRGEETTAGRWSAQAERYRDLGELLEAIEDPALVVLGPPGCGKSTLLRRLELDVSRRALRGENDRLTFFIQLNQYKGQTPGEPPPAPQAWLRERWSARYPKLPALEDMLQEGCMLLLLDALNEMPTASAADLRNAVLGWKTFLERLVTDSPGNRVVFSCRTLDYSAPLSTATLRVPQVVIEPLTDEQVERFLLKQNPKGGGAIWSELRGTPQLDLMRLPYFLSLLIEHVEATGVMPKGRAGLFTGFVRQSLRREIERDNPLFAPETLLTERDVRRVTQWKWKSDWELPERGPLVPKLADLAFGMQDRRAEGEASQVRIDFDEALHLLSDEHSEGIVRAGMALSVLNEDTAQDEILFVHQLTQEYFAARRLAANPEPERVRARWRAAEIHPLFVEVIKSLGPGESVPALTTTGWEETVLLAGAMAGDPGAFVRVLAETQLGLAGRCAAQPEVRDRLSPKLLDELRRALVARSRDPEADPRARIEAGLALGHLGDPRFERRTGPDGDYLLAPMVEIAGGRYPMGEDEPFESFGLVAASHIPQHEVEIEPFLLGRFQVTNAEWALFMESGGYEDERWWTTPAARRWRSGEGTADGPRANTRHWTRHFCETPEKIEEVWESGMLPEEEYERWKIWLTMSQAEVEKQIEELYPGGKLRQPAFWQNERYNNPAQPVVGVSWFEALAYANWLSAQTRAAYRLPTEAEWEAAARGREGRLFTWGDACDPMRGNVSATRVRRPTPVGIFPAGDTPEGVSDLTGNAMEWTSSLYGPGMGDQPEFGYPYRADDGRENQAAGSDMRRVLRGGGWYSDGVFASSAFRNGVHPGDRDFIEGGFRVALSPSSPIS